MTSPTNIDDNSTDSSEYDEEDFVDNYDNRNSVPSTEDDLLGEMTTLDLGGETGVGQEITETISEKGVRKSPHEEDIVSLDDESLYVDDDDYDEDEEEEEEMARLVHGDVESAMASKRQIHPRQKRSGDGWFSYNSYGNNTSQTSYFSSSAKSRAIKSKSSDVSTSSGPTSKRHPPPAETAPDRRFRTKGMIIVLLICYAVVSLYNNVEQVFSNIKNGGTNFQKEDDEREQVTWEQYRQQQIEWQKQQEWERFKQEQELMRGIKPVMGDGNTFYYNDNAGALAGGDGSGGDGSGMGMYQNEWVVPPPGQPMPLPPLQQSYGQELTSFQKPDPQFQQGNNQGMSFGAPQKPDPQQQIRDSNPLFFVLRNVKDMRGALLKNDMPFFWLLPPNESGGHVVKEIFDTCFDLNRAEVVKSDGSHEFQHISARFKSSQTRLLQTNEEPPRENNQTNMELPDPQKQQPEPPTIQHPQDEILESAKEQSAGEGAMGQPESPNIQHPQDDILELAKEQSAGEGAMGQPETPNIQHPQDDILGPVIEQPAREGAMGQPAGEETQPGSPNIQHPQGDILGPTKEQPAKEEMMGQQGREEMMGQQGREEMMGQPEREEMMGQPERGEAKEESERGEAKEEAIGQPERGEMMGHPERGEAKEESENRGINGQLTLKQPTEEEKKKPEKNAVASGTMSSDIKEDVIVSSNLYILPLIFNPTDPHHHHGKMFSFFMHPNHRFAYMFEYLKRARFEAKYDARIAPMTLLTYAKFLRESGNEDHIMRMSNWMTRALTQASPNSVMEEKDVELATQILKEKCIVLLYDKMEESMKRLKKLFQWEVDGGNNKLDSCMEDVMSESKMDTIFLDETSEEWELLLEYNQMDIQLYKNARAIFNEQGIEMFGDLI